MIKHQTIGLFAGKSGDSLTDELHKAGFRVALVCGKGGEPGHNKADDVLISQLQEHEQIYDFFASCGVRYFIVGTGAMVAFELAEYLEQRGMIPSINVKASLLMKDKIETKILFEDIDVLTPKYMVVGKDTSSEAVATEMGLPCVIKSSIDALQPVCANDMQELDRAIAKVRATETQVMAEKYISGGDTTYAIAFDGKTVHHIGPIDYSKSKEYGLAGFNEPYVAKISPAEAKMLAEISERIVRSFHAKGLLRIDYMIKGASIYALEVNSVIVTGYHGSAYPFFLKSGVNVAEKAVENALRVFDNAGIQ